MAETDTDDGLPVETDDTLDADMAAAREAENAAPVEAEEETPAEPEAEPDRAEQRQVPLAALMEERNAAREARTKARELEEKYTRLESRFQQILDAQKQPEAPPPNVNDDPIGFMEHLNNEVQTVKRTDAERRAQEAEQQRVVQAINDLRSYYMEDIAEIRRDMPHWQDAASYLGSMRADQLAMVGHTVDEIRRKIEAEELEVVMRARQSGKSPAQVVYDMAVKAGYKPPKAPQNGAEKIATVAKGQKQAASLSGPGGGQGRTTVPSIDEIASMTDEEFDKWTTGKRWKQVSAGL